MDVIRKIKNHDGNNLKSAVFQLETGIMEIVRKQFSAVWDADLMSASLSEKLCSLFNERTIHVPGGSLFTKWKAYCTADPPEKIFSSMAFILHISFHDRDEVTGAAFLDIHVKDPGKNTFSDIKKDAMRRLNTSAPHSQVLLCDYDAIAGMAFATSPEYIVGNATHTWNNWMPVTHAACIQTELALALGEKTTSLYKGSFPFSYQLCHRYFYGLDLEYHGTAMDIARGEKTDKGTPHYLITVSLGDNASTCDDDFGINRSLYREM